MRPQVESVYVATRCAILPRTPLTSSALAWRQPAIAYTQHCKAKGQISVKRPAIPFYYSAAYRYSCTLDPKSGGEEPVSKAGLIHPV